MKKMLFSVVAILVGFAAAAQKSKVDSLVEKYSTKDGVTVIKLDGKMLENREGMSFFAFSDDISDKTVKNIRQVTVISNDGGSEELAEAFRVILDGKEYGEVLELDSNGSKVRVVSNVDVGRNEQGEIVVTIDEGDKKEVLVRIVGDLYPPDKK